MDKVDKNLEQELFLSKYYGTHNDSENILKMELKKQYNFELYEPRIIKPNQSNKSSDTNNIFNVTDFVISGEMNDNMTCILYFSIKKNDSPNSNNILQNLLESKLVFKHSKCTRNESIKIYILYNITLLQNEYKINNDDEYFYIPIFIPYWFISRYTHMITDKIVSHIKYRKSEKEKLLKMSEKIDIIKDLNNFKKSVNNGMSLCFMDKNIELGKCNDEYNIINITTEKNEYQILIHKDLNIVELYELKKKLKGIRMKLYIYEPNIR